MNYVFASLSDPGLVRPNNEDALVVDAAHRMAFLADGMGGYNAGEVASSMAIAQMRAGMLDFQRLNPDAAPAECARHLQDCLIDTNRRIYEAALTHLEYDGMGTTLVALCLVNDRAVVGHVGDSRCYRWRDGALTLLTRDHSLLQEQIDAGLVAGADSPMAARRNLLTRAVGVEDAVLMDVQTVPIEDRDVFLLCSDGLTDMLSHEQLVHLLQHGDDLQERCDALVGAAKDAGGRDNISVVLVQALGSTRLRLPHWLGL
jgi:protein phosphatase